MSFRDTFNTAMMTVLVLSGTVGTAFGIAGGALLLSKSEAEDDIENTEARLNDPNYYKSHGPLRFGADIEKAVDKKMLVYYRDRRDLYQDDASMAFNVANYAFGIGSIAGIGVIATDRRKKPQAPTPSK